MEYKLCRNNLELLLQLGFKIYWTTVKVGYYGYDYLPPQLTANDICQFALNKLNFNDADELVARLACAENDKTEFENILDRLTQNENVSFETQLRKWIILLLFRRLETLSNDYTEGLVQLTEFWISLDLPDNCPHTIQGRNNCLSPKEYYTQAMYDILKEKNRNWLENEISEIIALEK